MALQVVLKKYGKYLAGRALPHDIMIEEQIEDHSPMIILDFEGVEIASQSFLEELFKVIRMKAIKPSAIKIINIVPEALKTKVTACFRQLGIYSETNGKNAYTDNA